MSKHSRRHIKRVEALHSLQTNLQEREQALSVVERAVSESQQPRFSATTPTSIFASIYTMLRSAQLTRPATTASVRHWDAWYRSFALREPFLSGILNSVVQIDKNRGWTLTGGRNQVNRYTDILHNADENQGWREYCAWQSQSFYTTRMGAVSEIGRDGNNGPLRALWSVDPARCQLTGNVDKPLRYFPRTGGQQEWLPDEFFRSAALVSTDEADLGLGNPAVARCLNLAEILIAVYEHDQEQLGARAPKGLLLLNGISEDQWNTAMEARDEALNSLKREYYGGVAILAGMGPEELKANLVALSQLPKDFDVQKFTELAVCGFALAFGYDAREFYPISSGSLGTGKEVEVGHRKTTSKGELDFSLAQQEKIQRELPPTLEFQFERRDDEGEMLSAQTKLAKSQVITEITQWSVNNQSVLTREQILQLAAEEGIIPDEWTETEEDVTNTDTEIEQARQNPAIQRAAQRFPDEAIVRYSSSDNQLRTLFNRGSEMFPRQVFPTAYIERSIESVVNQFHADLRNLVTLGFISDSSILGDMRKLIRDAIADAYTEGLKEGGIEADEMDSDDAKMIVELSSEQLDYVTDFVRAIRAAKDDKAAQRDILDNRVNLWTQSISAAAEAGLASAKGNEMVLFDGPDGDESCPDCQRYKREAHRRKWFMNRNLIPGKPGSDLQCGGFKCEHYFRPR